ncbi:MAG: MXAN_6640 family putative metalloprotease [Syntrophothermus sp.]
MYKNQRNFFLIALLFLSAAVPSMLTVAQNRVSQGALDSLYSQFIGLKTRPSEAQESAPVSSTAEPIKCGFTVNAQVLSNFSRFSAVQQKNIKLLWERPTLQKSILSPSGHVRIHFDTVGTQKPNYDPALSITENVNRVAAAFDSAYSFEVGYLGFLPPPADNMAGGDNALDIYIINEPRGSYGDTNPEDALGDNKYMSYIQIDNDFTPDSYATSGLAAMRVTVAHELHHSIQVGSYSYRDSELFFHELTSTSMEDFVFPDVGDYYKGPYLKNYFDNPAKDYFQNSGANESNGYRIGFWNIFLHDKFGFGIIKRQWELYVTYPAVKAISLSLLEQHSTFKNALDEFGIWTYFTGPRAIPGKYFKDAVKYPAIRNTQLLSFSSGLFPMKIYTNPLSNQFIGFLVPSSNRTDTLVVKLTDGDADRGQNNPASQVEVNYELFQGQKDNTRKIINDFYSRFTTAVTGIIAESDFYNNQLAGGQDVVYTETNYAYPNPYSYSGEYSSIPISLPVSFNQLRAAEIKIYTVAMRLVYGGKGEILDDPNNNSYYVKWNGRDNSGGRLQTGVYIYVTESDGNIKTGKILIKNE